MGFTSKIFAIDLHACGEPGRVITGGVEDVPGKTMFEKKCFLEKHMDGIRLRMLREPRGYPASNCNLLLPPTIPGTDAGFVIMEQVEYPPMSGTNTICVVTALLETGIVPAKEGRNTLKLDTPAGLVEVQAEVRSGKVDKVTFQNVPCFATHLDVPVEVPHVGTIAVDVAYGGMFYVIAEAAPLGFRLTPDEARDIVRVGEMIKAAAREQLPVKHPENSDIEDITIAQLSAPSTKRGIHRRNAVIVSSGELDWNQSASWTGTLDRSPCGSGHVGDRQVFGDDQAVLRDKPCRDPMDEVLTPVGDLAVASCQCLLRLLGAFRSLAAQRLGQGALLLLEGLGFGVEQPLVLEGVIVAGGIGKGGKCLDTPVQASFEVTTFPVRFARDDQGQEPAVDLAHDVGADDLAGCPRLTAGGHRADTGQPQLAVPPPRTRREAETVAVVFEPETGKPVIGLEPWESRCLPVFDAPEKCIERQS